MTQMKLDMIFRPSGDWEADVKQIKQAESLGFDSVWSVEAAHNPFFALTLAAKTTRKIQLGTQAAAAFPRSPMISAQIAWDLAKQSDGRFILGLGTQPPRHDSRQRRAEWTDSLERMREYIESIRAIWDTFQTGARLRYRGRHYQFRLMTPFFNPGPIAHPDIPIYLAGSHPQVGRLAGEIGQGLHVSDLPSVSYLKDVILPEVERGLAAAGRKRSDFAVTISVSDEMLNEMAGIAAEDMTASIRRRYDGLADRICLMWPTEKSKWIEALAREWTAQ